MCLINKNLRFKNFMIEFGMGHALKVVFSVSQALALKQSLGVWEFFFAVPSRDARKLLSSEAMSGPGLADPRYRFSQLQLKKTNARAQKR
jgi:hypothetical protein